MNYNRQTLLLVFSITGALLMASIADTLLGGQFKTLNNINILSDVVKKKVIPIALKKQPKVKAPPPVKKDSTERVFTLFNTPYRFTNFYRDSNRVCLEKFARKLVELKQGKRKKIRIAYIGDSMIEGDLISQTVRRLLQNYFGGNGVGYLPITSVVAGMRVTAREQFSNNWIDNDFKHPQLHASRYLSGHCFYANGAAWVSAEDRTTPLPVPLKKYLLTGATPTSVNLYCNGSLRNYSPPERFNRVLLDTTAIKRINVQIMDNNLAVYGLSFETDDGITLDNFSFRGASGIEFPKMESSFLQNVNRNNPYDLILLQYGVNLLQQKDIVTFDWYVHPMLQSIQVLKSNFPDADIALISTADKAFRYTSFYETAHGMDALLATQQQIAFESNIAFYNLYQSMGGNGSIVKWANSYPPLANKDYTHPKYTGAERLGKGIYDAIIFEYNKYWGEKKQ